MMKANLLQPEQVVQTKEKPYWNHPLICAYLINLGGSERFTDEEWAEMQSYFNVDIELIYMNDSVSDEFLNRYDNDVSVILEWDISQFETEGKFVISVCDTEDGACVWLAKSRLGLSHTIIQSLGEVP